MAEICPRAANTGTEAPVAAPKVLAMAPVRGSPENPDPSSPVRPPIIIWRNAAIYAFNGAWEASQTAQSFKIPV